jgi:hypothetical protein
MFRNGVRPVPLIVDGDTGFGNPLNTIRTMRLFERAGADGNVLKLVMRVNFVMLLG